MYVQTVPDWVILPSNNDNYVKIGGTQKLVDGGDSGRTQPPAFAYTGTSGWEVAFKLAPGSYTGDGGLNVHAEVTPIERADTSAVAGRRMDVVFSCPTPTPTPTTAPTPTAAPTEPPSEPASESPSPPSEIPAGSESASLRASRPPRVRRARRASSRASESPSLPSELPSGSEIPSGSEPASVEPESACEFPSSPPSELPSERARQRAPQQRVAEPAQRAPERQRAAERRARVALRGQPPSPPASLRAVPSRPGASPRRSRARRRSSCRR